MDVNTQCCLQTGQDMHINIKKCVESKEMYQIYNKLLKPGNYLIIF